MMTNLSSEKTRCMQTDTWLTDVSHPDRCPLCSQPLTTGSNICPACGFASHEPARGPASATRTYTARRANPITPIPARASALRGQKIAGGSPSRPTSSQAAGSFSTSSPEPTSGWRHASRSYEAASSLSSLSLIISETPTAPPRTTRCLSHPTGDLEHIDEIDTLPPASTSLQDAQPDLSELPTAPGSPSPSLDESEQSDLVQVLSPKTPSAALAELAHIDEIDTIPDPETGKASPRALQLVPPTNHAGTVDAASWSASPAAAPSLATRLLISRSPQRRQQRTFTLLDCARWWLLRPGHIEFLLWLAGSLLLFGITLLLLLAFVFSAMSPARRNAPTSTPVTAGALTPTTSANPRLELSGKSAFTAGAELRLQGQGFRPGSLVIFLLDGHWPLLDQHGQAASVQADASGHFAVNLWLGQGANWTAGPHEILARETDDGHQTTIAITIIAGSVTPIQGGSGPRATPVPPTYPTATPARPRPPKPTPTPASPSPTGTPSSTPTASSTGTATPTTPGGTATPSPQKTAGSSSLGNDLNSEHDGSLFTRLSHLNPLVWAICLCYLLSMVLMGLAGVLRRRHR